MTIDDIMNDAYFKAVDKVNENGGKTRIKDEMREILRAEGHGRLIDKV